MRRKQRFVLSEEKLTICVAFFFLFSSPCRFFNDIPPAELRPNSPSFLNLKTFSFRFFSTKRNQPFSFVSHFLENRRINFVSQLYVRSRDHERIYIWRLFHINLVWNNMQRTDFGSTPTKKMSNQKTIFNGKGRSWGSLFSLSFVPAAKTGWLITGLNRVCNSDSAFFFSSFRFSFSSCILAIWKAKTSMNESISFRSTHFSSGFAGILNLILNLSNEFLIFRSFFVFQTESFVLKLEKKLDFSFRFLFSFVLLRRFLLSAFSTVFLFGCCCFGGMMIFFFLFEQSIWRKYKKQKKRSIRNDYGFFFFLSKTKLFFLLLLQTFRNKICHSIGFFFDQYVSLVRTPLFRHFHWPFQWTNWKQSDEQQQKTGNGCCSKLKKKHSKRKNRLTLVFHLFNVKDKRFYRCQYRRIQINDINKNFSLSFFPSSSLKEKGEEIINEINRQKTTRSSFRFKKTFVKEKHNNVE